MEKIDIKELIDDLMQDPGFEENCEEESVKYALSCAIRDSKYGSFPGGKKYKFECVDYYNEKGDGKDEETDYAILKRKSDGKFFRIYVHDAGFIGPNTLTICSHMIEVKPKEKKIKTWDNF
jgi:hypothetical protein